MPPFLSQDWLALLAAAAGAARVDAEAELTVEQVVTGTPDGEVRYTVRVGAGGIEVDPAMASDEADVKFTSDWDTAVAVARGELAVQDAFMAGRLRLGGDVTVLLTNAPAIAALEDLFADVRAVTSYEHGG